MRKNFAITLIFISTAVYLTVFIISVQNHTGFFDEILNQLNRLNVSFNHKKEVDQSKLVLKTILENRTAGPAAQRLVGRLPLISAGESAGDPAPAGDPDDHAYQRQPSFDGPLRSAGG